VIAFSCAGETLVGSLDEAAGTTGVLIVAGGNEVRAGAHRGMAALAQALAAQGVPAFRFDRRGVGDSGGDNTGWEGSAPDLAAAVDAFREAQPHVVRIVGFGNCDGATALALFGVDAGIDALVLGNPWIGDDSPLPPPTAIRARYLGRLLDPKAWWRLLTGGLWSGKLWRGLAQAASIGTKPPLAEQIGRAVATIPTTIVLAEGDRTAQQFAAALPSMAVTTIRSGSHSFADAGDAVCDAIVASCRAVTGVNPVTSTLG